MKTIDHYKYWNKHRDNRKYILDRESKSINLIKKYGNKEGLFLDAGCGNGSFLLIIGKMFPKMKLKGIDYSIDEVKEAKKKKLDVKRFDFEKGGNLEKEKFDFIYAGEVIEHLYNPDLFLEHLNKSLKNGGKLLITTPNLSSWYNRILMLIGIQPLFLEPSTKSKLIGSGILKTFKKESQPVGHVRIFMFEGLKDILEMHGFKVLEVKGAIYDEGFPRFFWPIDRLFNLIPTLSSHLVIISKKEKSLNKAK